MKQTLTFNVSKIASTQSKINVEAFDASVDAFESKDYLRSFYLLLDYINPEIRTKYGNAAGNEFSIPHGSIVVNLKLDNDAIQITAPFLSLPEKNRIPLLRQIAVLNHYNMDLAQIRLDEQGKLYFEYSCPISTAEPYKLYYILYEICQTGDKYDDEFATKFGAERIYEPRVRHYNQETIDEVYDVVQLSCKECLDAVKHFEGARKYGYAWNIIACTLLKVLYYAHPQGQLMNDLNKAVAEHDREDIPLPEIVATGKAVIERLQAMTKEALSEDLYFVETFVPAKRRSSLKNIQSNFEDAAEKAAAAYEHQDYMSCCVMITYQFYNMYHYNNVQDDVNAVVVDALTRSSAKPWEEAAEILNEAMSNIMEGDLTVPTTAAMGGNPFNMEDMANNMMKMFSSLFKN